MILVTVSSEPDFHAMVLDSLGRRFRFDAAWDLRYGDNGRLRAPGADQKYVVVIDFSNTEKALAVAALMDGKPQFASIAVGAGGTRDELLHLMQAGVRDVLPISSQTEIVEAVRRALDKLSSDEPLGEISAFVPAKPGCGATTLATHSTALAAERTTEPALLLDFDIRLGVTSFLLKIEGNHTIVDALRAADRLDDDLWMNLVCQRGNLHVLGSGPIDFSDSVPVERFGEILDFAMRKYSRVSVDLPGTMEEYECATLQRAHRIFLVCTPDIGALHVTRRKSWWLRDLGLLDKVSVVLNCVERKALSVADIEHIIQLPIRYVVPMGVREVARAAQQGATIEGSSPLAQRILSISEELTSNGTVIKKTSPVRRFVEYFSISAARDIRSQ